MKRLTLSFVAVVTFSSCQGDIRGGMGDAGPPSTGCDGVAPATLDDVFAETFSGQRPTGCTASSCHGGTVGGGLTFTSARTLYDATVGRAAHSAPTHKLVDPGNANNSELYLRLLPSGSPRMPSGGPYLDDLALAAVAGWICAGAPPPGAAGSDAGTGDDAGVADAGILAVTDFTPASGVVGTAVTLTGVGFDPTPSGNVVELGALAAAVERASPTSLTVRIPQGATTRPFTVVVNTRTATSAMDFVVEPGNPLPVLTQLSPMTVVAGSADVEVTATGQGFTDGGVVRLDGALLLSRFVSDTTLTFTVPSSVLATAGQRSVTVSNPSPGGGTSEPLLLAVDNPAPTLASATPSSLVTNGAPTTVRLTGTNFLPTSEVALDGMGIGSTFVDSTTLDAVVPTVTVDGAHLLTVTNPTPGGGASAPQALTAVTIVTPVITSLSPSPAPAGQPFSLTVSGANYTCTGMGPVVLFNGAPLAASPCSATQLVVAAPGTAAGSVSVQVRNPNADLSNTVMLSLVTPNPVPVVASLSPASVNAGSTGAMVTVTGSGFVSASQATFSGSGRPTAFVSSAQLSVALTQSDLTVPGSYAVGVTNPAPGGGASNTQPLTVVAVNPLPTLSSLSPSTFVVGSSSATVTANGTGFVASSTVRFNGTAKSTTFISATQLGFALTSGELSNAGTFPVTVDSPSPGGGTSNSLSVSIGSPVPHVNTVSPCGVLAGSGARTLTLDGSGFVPSSVVRFNNTSLTTTYVSPTQLTAALPASAVATAPAQGQAATITVVTPAPGGGTSAPVVFGIAKTNVTLNANVQPIFTNSCATMGCHAGAMPAEGMVLDANVAADNLVNVSSTQCVGKIRVVACDPTRAGSVLADKILATGPSPACAGTAMPKMQPLTTAEKQAILDWIALGALP